MTKLRRQIREEAIKALKHWEEEVSVCRQVEALVNSLDDTLSDDFILKELRAINASGRPFKKVFATVR